MLQKLSEILKMMKLQPLLGYYIMYILLSFYQDNHFEIGLSTPNKV